MVVVLLFVCLCNLHASSYDGSVLHVFVSSAQDDEPELAETFRVQIVDAQSPTGSSNVIMGTSARDIRIAASDDPYGVFQIAAGFTSVTVDEGSQVREIPAQ